MSSGDRLKELIQSLLESPKSFSDGIGLPSPTSIYDVINGRRKLTPDLLKRIIDTYPNINPEWLLNGTLPKLLTDKIKTKNIIGLEEEASLYSYKCPSCIEKDKKIESLRIELETLRKEYIECLKEVSGLKNAASG